MVRRFLRSRLARREEGLTLVELLAVLAIVAVLVGVVTPTVSNTKDSAEKAQAVQDASTVLKAANKHFAEKLGTDVRTSEGVTTVVKLPTTVNSDLSDPEGFATTTATQVISDRWTESFITVGSGSSTSSAEYANVVTTSASDAGAQQAIDRINVVDSDGDAITGPDLLSHYTAIDFSALVGKGFLQTPPKGVGKKVEVKSGNGLEVSKFLWLFKKVDTDSADSIEDDSRVVALFQLQLANKSSEGTVDLTYVRIF